MSNDQRIGGRRDADTQRRSRRERRKRSFGSEPKRSLLLVALLFTAACAEQPEPLPGPAADGFPEPIEVRSDPERRLLDVEMVVDTATVMVDSANLPLRVYRLIRANGRDYPATGAASFPGPTFRVRRGDSVHIRLTNRLGPSSDPDHGCAKYPAADSGTVSYPNCFHGLNTTNIHFHGFHVSPVAAADDVYVEIAPGATWDYGFRVSEKQAQGTHWYHPHKHGSAAAQVMNGMSGAFIVEGGALDEMVAAMGIRERLIAIQQVDSQAPLAARGFGTGAALRKLVNGHADPVLRMRPGEVQRWRIVNENVAATATYGIFFDSAAASPTLYDIARDGIPYDSANYDPTVRDDSVIVAAGNRLDVLAKAPDQPGTYRLRTRAARTAPDRLRRTRGGAAAGAQDGVSHQLLTVVVAPDSGDVQTELPATLPTLGAPFDNLDQPADTSVVVVFNDSGVPPPKDSIWVVPPVWMGVNNALRIKFHPDSSRLTLPLGKTQRWLIRNASTVVPHPFHIHVNPFQVLNVEYHPGDANAVLYDQLNAAAARKKPIWLDTIVLPVNGTVTIVQRYDDFTGKTVMHCHILGHEEHGMMQRIDIRRE